MGERLGPFPDFSTSPSAIERRKTCARQHYLAVYESWGGWYTREEFPTKMPAGRNYGRARTAYILKNAKSRHGLLGQAVHKVAERHIQAVRLGVEPDVAASRAAAATWLHDRIVEAKEERWRHDPKGSPAITDLLYGNKRADDVLGDLLDRLPDMLDALEASKALAGALDAARARRPVAAERKTTFKIGLATVWLVPDLSYDDEAGRVIIVDWKTGRRKDEHRDQVNVYALARQDGALDGRPIELRLVYVGDDAGEVPITPVDEDVAKTRQRLLDEIEERKALVVDGDLARNEPLPIENFPMLPEGSSACRFCDFRRMCGRG